MEPFEVMCINSGDRNPEYKGNAGDVVEGRIYTVIDCVSGWARFFGGHINAYELAEFKDSYFDVRLFIPLSQIDETTFIRETTKQKA